MYEIRRNVRWTYSVRTVQGDSIKDIVTVSIAKLQLLAWEETKTIKDKENLWWSRFVIVTFNVFYVLLLFWISFLM